MESFLNKISEYNLFNYLLPGFVFIYFVEKQYAVAVLHEQILVNLFVAYFIGMVISRIGSVFIEKFYKFLRIVKYAEYKGYLVAEKEDEKLKTLVQENNTYRTFVSLFIILNAFVIVFYIKNNFQYDQSYFDYLNAVMLILFTLAYRKQTTFIRKRVERSLAKTDSL